MVDFFGKVCYYGVVTVVRYFERGLDMHLINHASVAYALVTVLYFILLASMVLINTWIHLRCQDMSWWNRWGEEVLVTALFIFYIVAVLAGAIYMKDAFVGICGFVAYLLVQILRMTGSSRHM